MEVNYELYKYFNEVAKAGNITRASEKLYVSQSAVSQAIMQLEERLGCKLLSRSTRGVGLTTEGAVLYSYISNATALIENAQEKLAKMRNLREGEIVIGASDTACSLYLLPILEKFSTKHSTIHVSVINRTTRELLTLLKNGTVDISFVNIPVEDDLMLEITPVMKIRDCFVVGEKYAKLADSQLSFNDLCNIPVLMLDESSNTRRQMDSFLFSHGIKIKPSIELESLSLLSEFAKIGLGVAATIKEDVQDMLDRGELYELRFNKPLPTRNIGFAQIKGVTRSFATNAFRDFVMQLRLA